MIAVADALARLPHFETFCSVEKLANLVADLQEDPRFAVSVLGHSVGGVPIHHVRFGAGRVKALFVAGPHAMEPIGSLTVFSLLALLRQGEEALLGADVEWHIVPCIDPDGAILNEGWTQRPFSMANYMKNFYLQATGDMVDCSFPVHHKELRWDRPSHEAALLKGLIDRTLPDFYFGLHNAWMGGAWYALSRDIGHDYYQQIGRLLDEHAFPLQKRAIWKEVCAQFAPGFFEMIDVTKHYDYVERTSPHPERIVNYGASSRFYLTQLKPSALTFVAEMGYVRHPSDESEQDTGRNLRKFLLRLDADSKFLASALIEEWDNTRDDLDKRHPIYRAVQSGWILPSRERLIEGGMPLTMYPTRDVLLNPRYDRTMTQADLFDACMVNGGFFFPRISYQFVRLLKASPPTPAVRAAIQRLDALFDEALAEIAGYIDFDAFEVIDCDTLAKVQLGSGLIALNAVLEPLNGAAS